MNSNSLISVIIPTYNRGSLILDSLNSVIRQTYKNLEIIIVDDCSTDNTEEIIRNAGDNRIIYHKLLKNSGACTARNKGIELANGEYIAFNDSDDIWHENKLEKQIDFLLKKNADVVTCKMDVYDESKNFMYSFPNLNSDTELTTEGLLKYNATSTQLLFGKAECFKTVQFDKDMPRFQDWEECLRLSEKFKVVFQNEILVDTYQQKDSITKNPQKGLAGMELLFSKYKDKIFSDKHITESFFKKMSAFSCLCGKEPLTEMTYIKNANPTLKNKVRYVLAKIGLYKILFMILQHM